MGEEPAATLFEVPKPLEQLLESEIERKYHIGGVMTDVLNYLTYRFVDGGFKWSLPVVLSESTDPLWPDPGASIEKRIAVEIYDKTVGTTASMIIHKIVACSLLYPRFFILSPNVRIEKRERASTGRHAYEFTQLDFEVRDASSKDIRSLVEGTICGLVEDLKRDDVEELAHLGRHRTLKTPEAPFKSYDKEELEGKYGKDWEHQLALEITDPVWVTSIPREFYDFEDFETGKWDNYDLILPQYGEVLSGAKREWEYEKIVKKMERDGIKKEHYSLLLKLAEEGRLKPSAGAGIGIERLVGWLVGAQHLGETQLFPKIPGMVYEL
jgi:asparaginyl-tRNA synthetase